MNLTSADQALQENFLAQWTYTPIVWTNAPGRDYDAVGQPFLMQGTDDFVELDINYDGSRAVVIPNTCSRHFGVMMITTYVRENAGTRQLVDYLDKLTDVLEFKLISTIRFHGMDRVGAYKLEGGWLANVVQFQFEFERDL